MPEHEVRVVIENRPGVSDPEGATILRDLVLKGPYGAVTEVRTARMLRMRVSAGTEAEAVRLVEGMCDDLRIYNPLVSRATVSASGVAAPARGRGRPAAGAGGGRAGGPAASE